MDITYETTNPINISGPDHLSRSVPLTKAYQFKQLHLTVSKQMIEFCMQPKSSKLPSSTRAESSIRKKSTSKSTLTYYTKFDYVMQEWYSVTDIAYETYSHCHILKVLEFH